MRTPTISSKRALGVAAAAALAMTGIIGLAGSSEAAAVTVTTNPKTASSTGGTIVAVTGQLDLDVDTGAHQDSHRLDQVRKALLGDQAPDGAHP